MADELPKTGWDEFLHWAAKFFAHQCFEEDERLYKIRAVEPLRECAGLLDGDEWFEPLRCGFQNKDNNIVPWQSSVPFLEWAEADGDAAREALRALWSAEDLDGPTRIAAFDSLVPPEVLPRPGVFCNLAAYLLGAKDPQRWPNYRIRALEDAYELTRFPLIPRKAPPGEHYGHALAFFDAMVAEARTRGIALRDRLDAQGLMWVMVSVGDLSNYSDLTPQEWVDFEAFREVPTILREERRTKKPAAPKARKAPSRQVCPHCSNDERVQLIGPKGDRWSYECEGGRYHAEPLEFTGG